ncbi:hypothetical protein BAE44_0016241 [Dichanthelium oligosanthes]|uniref:Cystatin domain-containing protein n=1 Tax=Dichanthelium oligosanthes TaxID=888268 RepID=A0A1E5VC77_9POAL|nr:hypothetical protein BAE44_0016241 [Dichanthelium oligosanthes]
MRTGLLFVIAVIAISVATPTMADLGDWYPINFNNPEIQEFGRWTVAEHVKQASDGIKFNKLVSAKQKLAGLAVYFDLIIDAWNSDGKDAKYEAVLHQRDWMDKRTLMSFKPAN